jgi:hypothetical protein
MYSVAERKEILKEAKGIFTEYSQMYALDTCLVVPVITFLSLALGRFLPETGLVFVAFF